MDSEVETLDLKGRTLPISVSSYDNKILEVPLDNIHDYLENSQQLYQSLYSIDNETPVREFLKKKKGKIEIDFENIKYLHFGIDNLIISEIRDSAYDKLELIRESSLFGLTEGRIVGEKIIPIARKDFVLNDESGTLLGYIELTDQTNSESWAHALYSQIGDKILVEVDSPSRGKPPHAQIYTLKNSTLADRL